MLLALYTVASVGRTFLPCLMAALATLAGVALAILEGAYRSIGPVPPTEEQRRAGEGAPNPLFRVARGLQDTVAWRSIGDFPTPLHVARICLTSGRSVSFWVKREDLSSPLYGGNKVRSLEYLLACCEAHKRQHSSARFNVVGSWGSNLCVGAVVHGSALSIRADAWWVAADEPERDNTLNLLSCLSFGGRHVSFVGRPLLLARHLVQTISSGLDKVFSPGGNNPVGQLGHVGAALELAEQIESGTIPDPKGIYLAAGSTCTLSGLILGVCLARAVGLKAFQRPAFCLHAVLVHHHIAFAQRWLGLLHSRYLPLGIGRSLRDTSALLRDCGAPDLTDQALNFLQEHVHICADPLYVGKYGDHSAASRSAKKAFEASGQVEGQPLWLCGHFSAKPLALLLQHLEEDRYGVRETGDADVIFWSTKSAVQPQGKVDEWERFQHLSCKSMREWSQKGGGVAGGPMDYRHIMTAVDR